jgi:hypothetical protein
MDLLIYENHFQSETSDVNFWKNRPLKALYDAIIKKPTISDDKYSSRYIVPWIPKEVPCYRREECMETRTGILLDFDAQQIGSYDSMIEWLNTNNLNFASYTTHSHMTKKKNNLECYRIILPFDKPIDVLRTNGTEHKSDYELIQDVFYQKWQNVDTASLRFNGSYAPCVSESMLSNYRCDSRFDGSNLNPFRKFGNLFIESKRMDNERVERIKLEEKRRRRRNQGKPNSALKESAKKKTIEKLHILDFDKRGTGVVHDSLLKFVANLKHLNCSLDEVHELILNNIPSDKKLQKEVKQMITSRFFA